VYINLDRLVKSRICFSYIQGTILLAIVAKHIIVGVKYKGPYCLAGRVSLREGPVFQSGYLPFETMKKSRKREDRHE